MDVLAVCLDGIEDEILLRAALQWVGCYERVEACCAYADAAEREMQRVRERHGHPSHPHPAPGHAESLDRQQAEAIAQRGVALMSDSSVEVFPRILAGIDPGHALVDASNPETSLLVLASHRSGPPGPHSIGHVARFTIDHARGPIIVIRRDRVV